MGALSFLWSYWHLILLALLGAAAAGYIAFVLKNWRAALAAGVLVGAVMTGGILYKRGYDARVAEDHARELKTLKARLATLNEIAEANEKRAEADAAAITELRRKIDETPDNPADCLDEDAAKRIGDTK